MTRRRKDRRELRPTILVVAVVLLCSKEVTQAEIATGGGPRSTAEAGLVAAHQALRRVPQQNPWGPNPRLSGPGLSSLVPEAPAALLQQLKNRLAAVVSQTLQTDGTGSLTPEEVRSRVIGHLDQLEVKVSDPTVAELRPDDREAPTAEVLLPEVIFPYGDILSIAGHSSAENPDLLVLAPAIGTGAGADISLYVFRRRERHWQLLLADHGESDYEVISSDHDVGLSPPDQKGNFFMVVTTMTGGLHSTQGSLRYRVLRPSRDPRSPKTLLRGDSVARLAFDSYQIRTQVDAFELEFISSAVDRRGKFDTDAIVGTRLLRSMVSGDHAKLVARRQLKPHEFDLPASADQ